MDVKYFFKDFKSKIKILWSNKFLRYAIIIHCFYFILSLVLTFTIFYEQEMNDFRAFYAAGKTFIININDLYSQENFHIHFRYFPLSAVLFIPFTLFNFDIGYILFSISNLILALLSSIIMYKIINLIGHDDYEKGNQAPLKYIGIFLMALPHIDNYVLGQMAMYVLVLVLISLYIILKNDELKWQFIGSIFLGISITIKPNAIFIVPFLVIFNYDRIEKKIHLDIKTSLARLIGACVPVLLNFILFIMYEPLLTGFINNNFGGNRALEPNFSFSMTKLIINFFEINTIPYNHTLIFLIFLLIFGGLGLFIFIFARQTKHFIIFGYTIGLLIPLLVYYDSWDHHLLDLIPILIIIIFTLPKDAKITRRYFMPSLIFFSFLDLAFLGFWFLIQNWFPYNLGSTVFLILTFYGVGNYCLKMEKPNGKEENGSNTSNRY